LGTALKQRQECLKPSASFIGTLKGSMSEANDIELLYGLCCMRPKIDKSVLTISEPKRIRCKEHLRFVASQSCLICGRSPSHAHHVRYEASVQG
jgi:hypothetical protein